ncbi:MAG: hypothetical protein P8J32_04845 [bacterium]|nr:hypothetical protein [bacterium]
MYYDLMYSVAASVLSETEEATPTQIIEALEARIAYLKANPSEIMEAVGFPEDAAEIDSPYPLQIEEFKKNWSQEHSEICSELGYDEDDAWELIPDCYFWSTKDNVWYNRESSLMTAQEELIAEYLFQKEG